MSATAGIPALTVREARLGRQDKDNGRHWSYSRCWCGAPHGGEAGVVFVAPPWDRSRDQERAW